ncbi:hypothetical protein BC833DRAFT_611125 [Globomyces pollinis-pini]|nr:hypothetical protein BC833DRAFT_611125 [Globomyces pollinis-pini]
MSPTKCSTVYSYSNRLRMERPRRILVTSCLFNTIFRTLFVFIWNILPVALIPIQFRRKANQKESLFKAIQYVLQLDKTYTTLLCLQIVLVLIYFGVGLLQMSTVLGNDKTFYLSMHILRTIVGISEIFISVMIEKIREMISRKFVTKN